MSILLTRYSEPVLVLFSDYSRHKVRLLRFYNYSRILRWCYTGRFATTSFSATQRRNLEQCCNHLKQCRNNVATLCCAKNRRCESSRATSPSKVFYVLIMKGNFSSFFLKLLYAIWTFQLFINDSSCYVRVFRKCECAKRFICHYGPQAMKFEPAPIIRPKFFDPLVTVLMGFHCSKRS